jgi:hypothetical protein
MLEAYVVAYFYVGLILFCSVVGVVNLIHWKVCPERQFMDHHLDRWRGFWFWIGFTTLVTSLIFGFVGLTS